MILNLMSAQELSGGWLNTDSCNLPFPHRDANLVDLKGYEICILTSSQVMLTLLVWEWHFENYCSGINYSSSGSLKWVALPSLYQLSL